MQDLLFLAHRIPFPPDKGDKIRSFNLLRHLSRHYRVYLGAFVDDPNDWKHAPAVGEFCEDLCLIPLSRRSALLRGLSGLARGDALTLPYFSDRRMARWVAQVLEKRRVRRVFAFSSSMAQYLLRPSATGVRRVLDFVDVDSDKWNQYSQHKPWPVSALYRREARKLGEFERVAAREFDVSIFVSQIEANLFNEKAPGLGSKVFVVENGVDAEFFCPQRDYPDPYNGERAVVAFTGAMDYWANVDAVCWFVANVLPALRERVPSTRFCIVGSRPTDEVVSLGRQAGVTVTGWVEDVRPYLAHAAVAVAPLRIARGIQNKVLEAMAMAKPVVASDQALDGLDFEPSSLVKATAVEDWVEETSAILGGRLDGAMGSRARDWVQSRYGWSGKVDRCRELLEGVAPPPDS